MPSSPYVKLSGRKNTRPPKGQGGLPGFGVPSKENPGGLPGVRKDSTNDPNAGRPTGHDQSYGDGLDKFGISATAPGPGGGGGGGAAGSNPLTQGSLKGTSVEAVTAGVNVDAAIEAAQGAKSTKKQRAKSRTM